MIEDPLFWCSSWQEAAWTYVAAVASALGSWLFYVMLLLSQTRAAADRSDYGAKHGSNISLSEAKCGFRTTCQTCHPTTRVLRGRYADVSDRPLNVRFRAEIEPVLRSAKVR